MLDCKMSSLSPATPINILSECYGIWEHENLNSTVVTKLEASDMLGYLEPGFSSSSSTTLSPLQHQHNSSRDYSFQTSQYLTPLPSLESDPYASSECQMLDDFHCIGNIDSAFHKFSEPSSTYAESYDSFIPDLNSQPPSHHHHQEQQMSQQTHQHIPPLPHSHGGGGLDGGHLSLLVATSPFGLGSEPPGLLQHPSSHHNYMWDDLGCDPQGEYLFLRKGDSPTTSDSISYTDVDSEMDLKSSRESLSRLTDIRNMAPLKRRVGRPPKKDKKLKRTAEKKTGRLWEFIRDLLKNPEYCPSLVRWENPDEGHFRFVNSEKVAQLWGNIKGNPRMTYEKLSRAMRYYYKSHVFEPVLGRRLVYKFGYNAVNWKPINPNFVQKLYN